MKESTKKRKALETLKKTMGEAWTNELEEELRHLVQLEEEKTLEEKHEAYSASREAESILALIARQDLFIAKICRHCNGIMASNYAIVAYCSDRCRRLALEAQGIAWDRKKSPEQRWGYRGDNNKEPFPAPLVVSAEALKACAHHPVIQQFLSETFMQLVGETPEDLEVSSESSDLQPTNLVSQDQT